MYLVASSEVQYVPFSKLAIGANPYGDTRTDNVNDIASQLKTSDDILKLPALDVDTEGKVIAGDRRYNAISNAIGDLNLDVTTAVPVRVHDISDEKERVNIAIAENERRKTATMVEKVAALEAALAAGYNQTEAAALFVDAKGQPQNKTWASTMLTIGKAFAASKAFKTLVVKNDIARRNAYEMVKLCEESVKNEETGKTEKVVNVKKLEKLVEKASTPGGAYLVSPVAISQASAQRKGSAPEGAGSGDGAGNSSEDGGDNPAPAPTAKLASGKQILTVIDEVHALVTGADTKDSYDGERWKEFSKLVKALLTGKDATYLAKRFKSNA